MKVELEIKSILARDLRIEHKIKEINKFMNWNANKLRKSIQKHGTSNREYIDKIINDFWGCKNG